MSDHTPSRKRLLTPEEYRIRERRLRVRLWAELCLCILENRPVSLLERPYAGPQLPLPL